MAVGAVRPRIGVDAALNRICHPEHFQRQQIGPVAAFRLVTVVERLPKTRSGKILRGTMRSIADRKTYRVPATIDDPQVLEEVEAALRGLGYADPSKPVS